MANYVFNPADYADGTSLDSIGWTQRFTTETDPWKILEVEPGLKVIRYDGSATSARRAISWDVIDADAGRADCEMLLVGRRVGLGGADFRMMVRGVGADDASMSMYIPGARHSGVVYAGFGGYNGGSVLSYQSNIAVTPSISNSTWFACRARVNGTTISVKIWLPANAADPTADEPAEWSGVASNSRVSAAGWVGLFRFEHSDNDIRALAFATGGDTATLSAPSDTTAPTLTSPSATATGATTASGSVTTNEANGTLYYLASANATELAATVKAGSSQAVTQSATPQSVSIAGLTASTSYYLHFVHSDAADNDSSVATSPQFTTSAEDTTPPTLTGPSATATGATTASGTVSTNEATGTLYWIASANASETATAVKAGSSQAVGATGTQNVSVSGLTASTSYYLHYLHVDAALNESAVVSSAQFTTLAEIDTTAPVLVGSVSFASVTQTGYTASWPAGSDNVAVTGYEYQIGGTAGAWTDAGNNLSAAITGRTAGATETVYVRAYDAAGNRSTPAISGEVTLESVPVAGINVTDPLKNNTGTVLASQSGVRVAVLQAADLVSVYETSDLTTNASGILAPITDAAITTGQQYHVAIKLADGSVGITGPITAS
jgi:hypothetical protein